MLNRTQTESYQARNTPPAVLLGWAALITLLNACGTTGNPQPLNLGDNFGNAVRHNIAAQVINPEAAGADESDRIDGQAAERALESQRSRSINADPESLIIGAGGSN